MNKEKFLEEIRKNLRLLNKKIVDEALEYYEEIIDDLIEDGYDQEEIIRRIGTPLEISNRILEDNKNYNFNLNNESTDEINEKEESSILKGILKYILLICTSPFWLTALGILFAFIILVLAVPFSIFATGFVFIFVSIITFFIIPFNLGYGIAFIIAKIGMSFMCFSVGALLLFFTLKLSEKFGIYIKTIFIRTLKIFSSLFKF